jgi:hypothetical protein
VGHEAGVTHFSINVFSFLEIRMDSLTVETFRMDDAQFDGNQLLAAGELLERIKEFLKGLNGSLPSKQEFLKIVRAAYETYVAPIDLPGVPNLFEPTVDRLLGEVVVQAASRLYDYFAGE